ncbi:hypothetical protein AB3K78_01370 [Leucobacter sp. HNU]|uniref:hypothetical protein n=1 Tax=Leucobacter sp. HNU TaxID=3236805 RepID=UPI003A7F6DFB
MKPPRATVEVQRQMLQELAAPGFLGSRLGHQFVEQVQAYIAPRLVGIAREWGSYPIGFDEMVNLVIIFAVDLDANRRQKCIDASSPWGYFSIIAGKSLYKEWGHRGTSLELLEWYEPVSTILGPGEEDPRVLDEIRIPKLAQRASKLLLCRTPAAFRADVDGLIEWLAWHPVQRLSYEIEDRKQAAAEFPALAGKPIQLVMNVLVGGRPVRPKTSLFAALGQDPDFQVAQAPTIARALMNYRRSMSAEAARLTTRELEGVTA